MRARPRLGSRCQAGTGSRCRLAVQWDSPGFALITGIGVVLVAAGGYLVVFTTARYQAALTVAAVSEHRDRGPNTTAPTCDLGRETE